MLDKQCLIPLLLSLLAGLSTVIGAFIVFFSKSDNKRLITFALAFSAGVMITISFTDLYPSAKTVIINHEGNLKGELLTLFFILIGAFSAFLIDIFLPEGDNKKNDSSLYRVGFVSMIALMLHNFPEGIATFVSGYEDTALGIYIAGAIAIHNIPEGISIAMPIYYATKKKSLAFKYTFISGIAEPIGGLLAFLFLKPFINDLILSIIFAIVAGIMLYIAFQELIPEARKYGYNLVYIFSLILGICIIPISHIFL